ncbi:hypothetical protein BASA81_013270 [Batrachochytrium salamandrivorans]|nr:hypothetical protein BASA81_013270 [Batrachochytrium salamandrivorans]
MTTSLQVFRAHMRQREDGSIDAHRILTRECYSDWLQARGKPDSDNEAKKFQRSLSNHLSGVDGRSAFDPEEEVAILKVVRKKECWPCFPPRLKIGSMGFRSKGFHEKQQQQCNSPPPSSPTATEQNLGAFADHILGYSTAFERIGIDVNRSIFGLLRGYFETQSPERMGKHRNEFAVSQAYAELLTASLTKKHGKEWAVTVYSYGDFAKRIVAQNEQSKEWYGDYTHPQAEQPILIQAGDWGKLTFNLGQAFAKPGVDFPTRLTCRLRDGTLCDMEFKIYCDPLSLLNVGISLKAI